MTKPIEKHQSTKVQIVYQIETLEGSRQGLQWTPLCTRYVKHEGKFIQFHKDFSKMTGHSSRVFTEEKGFAFEQEAPAQLLAKALSKVWDMPLRVMKVQNIRVQTPCGKVILPVGGV
jgi:hypothetical protein